MIMMIAVFAVMVEFNVTIGVNGVVVVVVPLVIGVIQKLQR
jgi:hypothetical protein